MFIRVAHRAAAYRGLALRLVESEAVYINDAHSRPSSCFNSLLAVFEHDTPVWFNSQQSGCLQEQVRCRLWISHIFDRDHLAEILPQARSL